MLVYNDIFSKAGPITPRTRRGGRKIQTQCQHSPELAACRPKVGLGGKISARFPFCREAVQQFQGPGPWPIKILQCHFERNFCHRDGQNLQFSIAGRSRRCGSSFGLACCNAPLNHLPREARSCVTSIEAGGRLRHRPGHHPRVRRRRCIASI